MRRGWWHRAGFAAVLAVILTFFLFPVYFALISSFAGDGDQFAVRYLPRRLNPDNYLMFLHQRGFVGMLANSAIVALVTVSAALVVAVLAAYALGRVRFRGRGLLLMTILACSMFPQIAVLAGMFELVRALGIYNTIWAMVLAQTAFTLPFTVWLLTVFMRGLPVEIEEAAVIDGATPWIVVTRIFLPLLAPAFATTGLLAFIGSWNEFLFALTLTISENQRTAPIAMSMVTQFSLGQTMAAGVIVMAPVVAVTLIFQRRIVAGLTAGGVVG